MEYLSTSVLGATEYGHKGMALQRGKTPMGEDSSTEQGQARSMGGPGNDLRSEDQLLTPEQVSERLQMSPLTLLRWLRTGRLPGVKLGKFWRVRASDLEAFLHTRQRERQAPARAGAARRRPGPREGAAAPPEEGDGAQASAALVALIRTLFPEGQPIAPRPAYGLAAFPLQAVNRVLQQHGLVLHTSAARRRTHRVACTDRHGQVEFYGVFELRWTAGSTR